MKKIGALILCCFLLTCLASLVRVRTAQARSTYAKAFKEKYVGDESTDAQKALAADIKRVKTCYVCHDAREEFKKSKKNRNPFGKTLAKLLNEDDQKDKEKALKMLSKVETEKAEGSDETFGQRIKAGKVPFEYKEDAK